MRQTKNIDSVGKTLQMPLDSNDQTLGVTISGEFEGVFQIVGLIDLDGREIELQPYLFDGGSVDLDTNEPLDFFVDVGGLVEIRISAISWTSGLAQISAITSSARRGRTSSGGVASEVEVTNFPTIQAVTGPLTNNQLRSSPVNVLPREFDTTGLLLPTMFYSVTANFTYNGELIETEVRVVDGVTYTRTYTYTGEYISSVSGWVRS